MSTCNKITEEQVMDFLLKVAKANNEVSPRCIVMTRSQKNKNSITRTVRFALIVTSNNTKLIDALIQECLDNQPDVTFIGSEVNLQSDLSIDYLYFEADIYANIER